MIIEAVVGILAVVGAVVVVKATHKVANDVKSTITTQVASDVQEVKDKLT
jgi:hypothetical protein